MATRKTTRRSRPQVDRHGTTTPPPEAPISARCELGDCAGCRQEVLSLLWPVGTRCAHHCHATPAGMVA
jgi:hypothetical protein